MTEPEVANALFGLVIGASIWIPLLAIQRWSQNEIERLRSRIDAISERVSSESQRT